MAQDASRKDRASGVVPDPLPENQAVPRRELLPNAHERMLMQGSALYRKRTRKPAVDLASNPACADRQLTDAYELMRRNRNPALYRPTKADLTRSTNFNEEHGRALAAADVNTVKLRVLESIGADAEAAQVRLGLQGHNSGSVSTAPGGAGALRRLEADDMPRFDTYTKPAAAAARANNAAGSSHQPTYGHPHKPRVFNPLTNDLIRKPSAPAAARAAIATAGHRTAGRRASAGLLGVGQLRNLLNPNSTPGGGALASRQQKLTLSNFSSSSSVAGAPGTSLNLDVDLHYATRPRVASTASNGGNALEQPVPWDASFASARAVLEAQNSLPHPGASSLSRDEANAASFRDKLRRSRAAAAGMRLDGSELCFDRQVRQTHTHGTQLS